MAQMFKGTCVRLGLEPNLQPPNLGHYYVPHPPMCTSAGELAPRRTDAGKANWTGTGRPAQTHGPPNDNFAGLATEYKGPIEWIATEQGEVGLKFGAKFVGYSPPVSQLKALPYMDTRRSAISDRYYR